MNDQERAIEQLQAMIRQRRVTSDDVRYLGQWVRAAGAHACDDIREMLRANGYEWMTPLVGQSIA